MQDNTQFDPSIVALMHGIKANEGANGNYNATGDKVNGQPTAAGIGMWSNQVNGKVQPLASGGIPENFKGVAQRYGLDPTDFSPENQNKVMYSFLADGKKAGKTPEQLLSQWNSGDPNKYMDTATSTGQGQVGHYDVATYVKTGMTAAQQYAQSKRSNVPAPGQPNQAGGSLFGGALQAPQAPQGDDQTQSDPSSDLVPKENLIQKAGDVVAGVGGALFPIIPDIINKIKGTDDKTALQTIGDAGLSALWFLPFGDIARGAELGAKAFGIGETAARTAGVAATSVGTGYGADVASNLSQGKTGASVATPGLGTAIGAAVPVAGASVGALYNKFLGQKAALDKVAQAYEDAGGSTKAGVRNVSRTAAKNLDPNAEFLAYAGIKPETEVINGRRVWTTGATSNSQQTLNQRIENLAELRDEAMTTGKTVDLGNGTKAVYNEPTVTFSQLRQQMLTRAEQDFSGEELKAARLQINKEMNSLANDPKYVQRLSMDDLKADPKGDLTANQVGKIKTYLQGQAQYDRPTQGRRAAVYDTMANTTKKAVEDAATKSGNPLVKEVNKTIQQHYDALKFLEQINGNTLKGGRLGGYVKEGIGGAVGGSIANALGKGVIGDTVGLIGGAYSGHLLSGWMQSWAAGGARSAATLGRMAKEDPAIVKQLLEFIGRKGTKEIAPMITPPKVRSGITAIKGLMARTPGSKVLSTLRR